MPILSYPDASKGILASLFAKVRQADQAAKKALPRIDRLLEAIFGIISHNAFSQITAFLLFALGATDAFINKRATVALYAVCLYVLLWVARSSAIKRLTALFRVVVLALVSVTLVFAAARIERLVRTTAKMAQEVRESPSERIPEPQDKPSPPVSSPPPHINRVPALVPTKCVIGAKIDSRIFARLYNRYKPTPSGIATSSPSSQSMFYEWKAAVSHNRALPVLVVDIDHLLANDDIITEPIDVTASSKMPRSLSDFPNSSRTPDYYEQFFTFTNLTEDEAIRISIHRPHDVSENFVSRYHVIQLKEIRGSDCQVNWPEYDPIAEEKRLVKLFLGLGNWEYNYPPSPHQLPTVNEPGNLTQGEIESTVDVRCKTDECKEIVYGTVEVHNATEAGR